MEKEGRRNLSPLQRVQIAEKYRPIFVSKAKENMLATQNNNQASALQKSSTQVHTRDELAKIAKVSHDTYGKAKKIVDLKVINIQKWSRLQKESIPKKRNGRKFHFVFRIYMRTR